VDWRLIDYQVCDPFYNMACDEAIFDAFCGGWSPPTVRFYGWSRPAISLGYLQPAEGRLDPAVCASRGVDIVRRPTGGRAVAHGGDLTFSITLDSRTVEGGGGIASSYRKTGEAVAIALCSLGIDARFCRSRSAPKIVRETVSCFDLCLENEVSVCGKKILGCAQLRRGNALMQQNSLAVASPPEQLLEILGVRKAAAIGQVASVEDMAGLIRESIERVFGVAVSPGELSDREKQAATRLESRYRSDQWNSRRPGAIDTKNSLMLY